MKTRQCRVSPWSFFLDKGILYCPIVFISLDPQDSVDLTGLEECGPEQHLEAAGMKKKKLIY